MIYDFVDFHTHILPGADHGAKDIKTSIFMIKELISFGVSKIILTPHFYPSKMKLNEFLEKRNSAYENLKKITADMKVSLKLGSEVYFNDSLFSHKDFDALCIEGTRYLLTELPYTKKYQASSFQKLQRLASHYDIIPVLAHVDRYPYFKNNLKYLREIIDEGFLCQMNLSAFSEYFGKKKCLSLILNNFICAFGSDSHKAEDTKYYYSGIEYLKKYIDDEQIIKILQAKKLNI